MVSMNTLQFLACGMIFTGVGWYWGYSASVVNIVQKTIDHLIDDGFIRTRIDDNGEIELIKYSETVDE